VASGLVACTQEVAAGLDEPEANRAVATLVRAGLDARREPEGAGTFRVIVPSSEATRGLVALADEGLPHPKTVGVLEAVGKNQLVPTIESERAGLAVGLAGELDRTFMRLDGVTVARTHLVLPGDAPLREKKERGSASVLLSYATGTPPIQEADVKRVVSAAVSGLSPDDVTVVLVPRAARAPAPSGALAHVGPIGVAAGSAGTLRLVLAVLASLVGLLSAATIALTLRLAKAREARS
jgi:type III secretion system YscJ/HrcJ family lipoprotein